MHSLIIRKQTAPLTSDQLFVDLWHCRFLLLQDINPESVLLTKPLCKTNTPRSAQMGAGTFAIYTTWVLGMKMITVSV